MVQHGGPKNHKCDQCVAAFYTASTLRRYGSAQLLHPSNASLSTLCDWVFQRGYWHFSRFTIFRNRSSIGHLVLRPMCVWAASQWRLNRHQNVALNFNLAVPLAPKPHRITILHNFFRSLDLGILTMVYRYKYLLRYLDSIKVNAIGAVVLFNFIHSNRFAQRRLAFESLNCAWDTW